MHRLWIVAKCSAPDEACHQMITSIPGSVGPLTQYGGQGNSKKCSSFDHQARRSDLDKDRGHLRFPQYGQGHSVRPGVVYPQYGGYGLLNQFSESASTLRLVMPAGPVGGATLGAGGIEPEAEKNVGSQLICFLGLGGVVRMVQLGDLHTLEYQPPPQCAGHASQSSSLPDR